MNKDIFIHSIKPILPKNYLPQRATVDWIIKSHLRSASLSGNLVQDIETRLRRFALNDTYIRHRYFECNDVDENWEDHAVYKLTPETPNGVSIGERNKIFTETAIKVMGELYSSYVPSHLIHVTCTGYASPSAPQEYFANKDKAPSITHAYHMGCYASLPAVRMAQGLHLVQEEEIDVVHTELCSLHLNPSLHSPEQMVVQSLFADGHIKYSVGKKLGRGFRILRVKEKLIPASSEDMTWVPDSFGMSMTLSKEVPFKIRDFLPEFISELCAEAGVRKDEILENAIFAIHPGGPKIIEAVQKKLELKDTQVQHSKKVLYERGNMSSATLPHVWNEILNLENEDRTKVVSLAFGPGLTIFGSLFEVHL